MIWLRKSREWFISRAESAHAKAWLFVLTAAEAIVFPLPIDPLLVAILLVNSKKWLRYALLTTAASVVGAFVGYFIGLFFFDIIGKPLIAFYSLQEQFASVQELLTSGVFVFTLVSAVVPIPFKIFVLAAGFTKSNLFLFMLAAILGRGARYILVAYLTHRFGVQSMGLLRRYSTETALIGLVGILLYTLYVLFI